VINKHQTSFVWREANKKDNICTCVGRVFLCTFTQILFHGDVDDCKVIQKLVFVGEFVNKFSSSKKFLMTRIEWDDVLPWVKSLNCDGGFVTVTMKFQGN
jgi:hypothetical protein